MRVMHAGGVPAIYTSTLTPEVPPWLEENEHERSCVAIVTAASLHSPTCLSIPAHLPRCSDPSGRVHGEAADVVGVVEVEPLPVFLGVVAHASPARVVHHLFVVRSMLNDNRRQMK